jgi:hypothetical protein
MPALFMVRAQVLDPKIKNDFDRWYQDDHLPAALKAFNARRAWRGWSDLDAGVHYAWYEFADLASARAIVGSEGLKRLVMEFEQAWGDKVARSRDFVDLAQAMEA